jgi:hypothetical protein
MTIKSINTQASKVLFLLVEHEGKSYFIKWDNATSVSFGDPSWTILEPQEHPWVEINENRKLIEMLVSEFESKGVKKIAQAKDGGEIYYPPIEPLGYKL